MIQASKPELRIMRDELTDQEWAATRPMLPNKPRDRSVSHRKGAVQVVAAGKAGPLSGLD
jgi:transposase